MLVDLTDKGRRTCSPTGAAVTPGSPSACASSPPTSAPSCARRPHLAAAIADDPSRSRQSPTFRSLHNHNYRLYATGGVVSNTGTWMQRVAQDWLVVVLRRRRAIALGITTGLQFLPALLLSPYAGLVADRVPKQRLLQLTQSGMAVTAALLGVLAVTGTARSGTSTSWPSSSGRLGLRRPGSPELRERDGRPDDLSNAVGLNSASFNAARIAGPALAGR